MNTRILKKSNIYKAFLNIKSFASADPALVVRISLIFLIIITITTVSVGYWITDRLHLNQISRREYLIETAPVSTVNQTIDLTKLPEPNPIDIELAETIKVEQEKIKAEEERIAALRQVKVDKLAAYLKSQSSPMAPYANIIIEEAERCGANYRIIVAIAGNESGYGRVSYKLYNPYGYLNGVQYSGWDQSLRVLTCKVAAYTNKYGNNIEGLGKAYGAHNVEQWVNNINSHLYKIP